MKKGQLFIGTSGWVKSDWKKIFYPEDLQQTEWLKFYGRSFSTVEINTSFYHLPSNDNFSTWRKSTPKNFIFSIKLSRYVTHIERLKNVKSAYQTFLKRAAFLKDKHGPILVQFPPSFIKTPDTFKRLNTFLSYATKGKKLALEFRDPSWDAPEVIHLLKKNRAALVIADSQPYPKFETSTADFVYIRLHGPKELFNSKYTPTAMKKFATSINQWLGAGKNVYVYFNNDVKGYAVVNAMQLKEYLGEA